MNDPIPAPEPRLTPEELVARARDLVPFLRERAPELEEKRRISDEVVRRLIDAGIFRTIQPRRFGGYEFDLRTFARVMTELSRGDGAVGWVATLNSGHPFWAAKLALDGQVEVFGADGDFRCPLVLRPGGVARPVDGGYELDGRWDYTSGGEVSNWLGVNAIVPGTAEGDPPSDMVLAFLRRADYEVVDNWFVMGMRGTGSKQAWIENVFVPERRVLSFEALSVHFNAPGHGVHENPFYQIPDRPIFCIELSCIGVGLASAAIDALREVAETKAAPMPPFAPLKETRKIQLRMGHATAKLEAARAGLFQLVERSMARGERIGSNRPFTDEEVRLDQLLATEVVALCAACVDVVFGAIGTSGTRQGFYLERVVRDIHMLRTHMLLDPDRVAENWGAFTLGLEPQSRF